MHLKNLNLVELNAQEVQEVNGGKWKFWVFKCTITGVLDGNQITQHRTKHCLD